MLNLEGEVFDGFEVERKLGAGGMGAVYLARQTMLRRPVALKTMAPNLAQDAEYVARFEREAMTAANLSHPNIVQVYAGGQHAGAHYIAMEYVEGETLQARIERQQRVPPHEAVAVALYVAQALQHAWNTARLIHRDIKPDNIFLSTKGEVKLGDLGLAKIVGGDGAHMTSTGVAMGTPHYISPEQANGERDVDFRADIYSLGCTLFHALAGHPPYQGKSALAVMAMHLNAPPASIFKAWPACPRPLGLMVSRMMARDREKRYPKYEDLVAELWRKYEALKPGAPLAAQAAAVPAAAGRKTPAAAKTAASAPQPGGRRWLPAAIAGSVTLLAVVGLLLAQVGKGRGKPPPRPAAAVPAPKPPAQAGGAAKARGPAAGQAWTAPTAGMEFVWVPALKLWVGKYEVTNGEYRKLKPEHDSQSYGSHSLNGERQPVAFVNFDDASAYAEGLTRRERAAGTLPDEFRYRLPSEQEWQAFAQCGDGRKHPWGDEMPPAYGNYSDQSSAWTADRIKGYEDGFPVTCPVEKSGRNDWGLYGVGGNVFECCAGDVSGASFGAWRGASWSYVSSSILQCSHRFKLAGTDRNCNCGFRLVLSRTASPAPAVDAAQPAADVQEEDRKPGDATAVDLGGGVKLDMAWISPPVSPPGPSS